MNIIEELKQGKNTALTEAASMKSVAEILGQMSLAKKFPRKLDQVLKNSLVLCSNKKLAEISGYSIPRKNAKNVEGPSIRLMEAIASEYGNLNYGIKTETDDFDEGLTRYTVFVLDLEKNIRVQRTFSTRHIRYTKKGIIKLTKDQEIYEATANNATRRLRVCLEQIIPKWIVDECFEKCQQLNASTKLPPTQKEKIIDTFSKFNVTKLDLETKIGKTLDKATDEDIKKLRIILNGIKNDGVQPSDYFGKDSE